MHPAQRCWPSFLAELLLALPKLSIKMQMPLGRKLLQKTGANIWDYVIRWSPPGRRGPWALGWELPEQTGGRSPDPLRAHGNR